MPMHMRAQYDMTTPHSYGNPLRVQDIRETGETKLKSRKVVFLASFLRYRLLRCCLRSQCDKKTTSI